MAARVVVSIALVLAPNAAPDVVAAQLGLVTADGPPAPLVSTVGLSTPDGVPAATTQPTETAWPTSPPNASTADVAPTTSIWPTGTPAVPESSSAATVSPALPVESIPPEPPPLTPAELVDAIFGWPGRQLVTCESRWNRWAVGAAGERGPMQIHPVHRYGIVARLGYTWDDMFEWEPNLRVAVEIRRVQGLTAWTCYGAAA